MISIVFALIPPILFYFKSKSFIMKYGLRDGLKPRVLNLGVGFIDVEWYEISIEI